MELAGLTCTEQNFITKSGAQKYAAEHGLIIVAPDTSPRGFCAFCFFFVLAKNRICFTHLCVSVGHYVGK